MDNFNEVQTDWKKKFCDAGMISKEEKEAFVSRIENINVINEYKEDGTVKAKKLGAVFPLTVIAAFVLILGFGFFVLSTVFARTDRLLKTGAGFGMNAAEQEIIEEIKREADILIDVQRKEIARIQAELKTIDSSNMDIINALNRELALHEEEIVKIRIQEENRLNEEYAVFRQQEIPNASVSAASFETDNQDALAGETGLEVAESNTIMETSIADAGTLEQRIITLENNIKTRDVEINNYKAQLNSRTDSFNKNFSTLEESNADYRKQIIQLRDANMELLNKIQNLEKAINSN